MQHFLPCQGAVEAVSILPTVPHHQFRVWGDGLRRVEINIEVYLTRDQVLLGSRVGEICVVHPVATRHITVVKKLVDIVVFENLKRQTNKQILNL